MGGPCWHLVRGSSPSKPPASVGAELQELHRPPVIAQELSVLTRILFENVWLLIAVLVPIEFMFIAIWYWRRSPRSRTVAWVGFAAIPLLVLLSILVVTSREWIIQLCGELALAVEAVDIPTIDRHLADDFALEGYDRDELLNRLEGTLRRFRVSDVALHSFEVTVSTKNRAEARFGATCRIRSSEQMYEWLPSRWHLTFQRAHDVWHVTNVESLPTPPLQIRHLRDWLSR